MTIRVITTCTREKRFAPEDHLTQADFWHLHIRERFAERERRLAEYQLPAEEMYTGQHHVRLMRGVRAWRERYGADSLDLWILSAGYGLIPGTRPVVPYDCTFNTMDAAAYRAWTTHLKVAAQAHALWRAPADITLFLLSEPYLEALALDPATPPAAPTVMLTSQRLATRFARTPQVRVIVLGNQDAHRFGCALVALKGELGGRILETLARDPAAGRAPDMEVLDTILDNLDL